MSVSVTVVFTLVALALAESQTRFVGWGGDPALTKLYPDAGISRAALSNFTRLHDLPLSSAAEQVYAQPLVFSLDAYPQSYFALIATEHNYLYTLLLDNGTILMTRRFGEPYDITVDSNYPKECRDLAPHVGITGTPVIDTKTGTAHFIAKSGAASNGTVVFTVHAVDVLSGESRPNFPITLNETVRSANSRTVFTPGRHHHRAGLTVADGRVFTGFGSHCDVGDYVGWIASWELDGMGGVSMWDVTGGMGVGGSVWQAGARPAVLDGRSIFVTTANGRPHANVSYPSVVLNSTQPPALLTESVVRFVYDTKAVVRVEDFLMSSNYEQEDRDDIDFGSAGVTLPPASAFTARSGAPVVLILSKAGTLAVINRDSLGGFRQGQGGTDRIVTRFELGNLLHSQGVVDGIFSTPSTWASPAGAFIYVTAYQRGLIVFRYDSNTSTLTMIGSGLPAKRPGQALLTASERDREAVVWLNDDSSITAYGSVPVNGTLPVLFRDTDGVHTCKFTLPGIGGGLVVVATCNGRVLIYGEKTYDKRQAGSSDVVPADADFRSSALQVFNISFILFKSLLLILLICI